jgi:acetyl-CoA C-acetyltransferase
MCEVVIAGIGQVSVGEHWDVSLRSLAARAMLNAQKDAGGLKPQALYVGNLLASVVSHQSNLGTLLADNTGLGGIEAFSVEAAEASGAGAFRLGYLAVLSGYVDTVMVVGVEKFTDVVGPRLEAAMAETTDYDFEAVNGLTPTAVAGLIMRRYLDVNQLPATALAGFPILAHANAVNNPNAYFHRTINRETYERAGMISDPVNLYDKAPYADGAAAVILTRSKLIPEGFTHPQVQVCGSSIVIDRLALHDRSEPLGFDAAALSVQRACRQAGILPSDADLFELCDSFSVYAALSLEAAGFAPRGQGWQLAEGGDLSLGSKIPVSTMGGWKGRGNPAGASGIYQIVEAVQQLRGEAGVNQVKGAHRALVQALGGAASTAITHVLQRKD